MTKPVAPPCSFLKTCSDAAEPEIATLVAHSSSRSSSFPSVLPAPSLTATACQVLTLDTHKCADKSFAGTEHGAGRYLRFLNITKPARPSKLNVAGSGTAASVATAWSPSATAAMEVNT